MCHIFPLHFRFVPESQVDILRIHFDTYVLRAIGLVILRWAPNETGEKNAKHFLSRPRINPGSLAWQSDTLPCSYKSRLVPKGSTSVYYILHYHNKFTATDTYMYFDQHKTLTKLIELEM